MLKRRPKKGKRFKKSGIALFPLVVPPHPKPSRGPTLFKSGSVD
jgi:hypothetical protein